MELHNKFAPMFLKLGVAIQGSEKQTNMQHDCFAINLDLVYVLLLLFSLQIFTHQWTFFCFFYMTGENSVTKVEDDRFSSSNPCPDYQ